MIFLFQKQSVKLNGARFNLLKPVWLPHGVVAVAILASLFLMIITRGDLLTILLLTSILILNQFLGHLFPKKL